jgi:gamma-tubulin complex component 2
MSASFFPRLSTENATASQPMVTSVHVDELGTSMPDTLKSYTAMHELLYNLLGISSEHVTMSVGHHLIDGSFYTVNENSADGGQSVALYDMLDKMLPLGGNYLVLKNFTSASFTTDLARESGKTAPTGLLPFTLRALQRGMQVILRDYEDLVVSLEERFFQDMLTMQEIFCAIQKPTEVFDHLCRYLIKPISTDASMMGCRLILHLSNLLEFNRMHSSLKPIYTLLLEVTMEPIWITTEQFMTTGKLYDPYKEYFILEAEHLKKEDLQEDYNATYWAEKYSILDELVPPCLLLQDSKSKILLTGKYVRVLLDCHSSIDIKEPDGNNTLLSDKLAKIEFRYKNINRLMMDLLMAKHHLIPRLNSIKKIFFMQYGDVFCHFLDLCEVDLNLPVEQVSLDKLQTCLDHCISVGTSKEDVFCNSGQIRIELSSRSFSDQLARIVNVSTNPSEDHIMALGQASSTLPLTGLLAMTLTQSFDFPLSIVLSLKSITKYAMIFRHLLSCRSIQRQLDKVLLPPDFPNIRLLEQRMDLFRTSSGRLRQLEAKLSFFLRILNSYLFWDVLEYHWGILDKELNRLCNPENQSPSIDQIIQLHTVFLDCCLKECLLTNWKLFRIVSKLLTNAQMFISLCKKVTKDISSIPIEDINGTHLMALQGGIYKQLTKIDTNFSFHIQLLIQSLQFFSTTDYDHRIAGLIFQLESAFPESLDAQQNPDKSSSLREY